MTTPEKTMSILLVDDEEEFASTLAERLRLRGYEARAVFDGESALALLEQGAPEKGKPRNGGPADVDLVLLDMLLPGIHGSELVRRILDLRPGLPVILLTGQAGSEDGVEGLRSGARACLAKPLDLGELLVLFGQLQEEKADA